MKNDNGTSADSYRVKIENIEDIDGIQQIASLFYTNGYYNEAYKYFNIVWGLDSINCKKKTSLLINLNI